MNVAYLIEPPFNYLAPKGRVTGCDVGLARYVLNALGYGEPNLVETEFAHLLPGLKQGRWRMTTGLFATKARKENALFSRPIWALPDGLLVGRGNPLSLCGYRSIAAHPDAKLAIIRDQAQHASAVALGVDQRQIAIFETYGEAAKAVADGHMDAYASVARAHAGFIGQNPKMPLDYCVVPAAEKPPACGAFAFALSDDALCRDVDAVLSDFLGSQAHRDMVAKFGFSDSDVDLLVAQDG